MVGRSGEYHQLGLLHCNIWRMTSLWTLFWRYVQARTECDGTQCLRYATETHNVVVRRVSFLWALDGFIGVADPLNGQWGSQEHMVQMVLDVLNVMFHPDLDLHTSLDYILTVSSWQELHGPVEYFLAQAVENSLRGKFPG